MLSEKEVSKSEDVSSWREDELTFWEEDLTWSELFLPLREKKVSKSTDVLILNEGEDA